MSINFHNKKKNYEELWSCHSSVDKTTDPPKRGFLFEFVCYNSYVLVQCILSLDRDLKLLGLLLHANAADCFSCHVE